jgi:hypothetical protein
MADWLQVYPVTTSGNFWRLLSLSIFAELTWQPLLHTVQALRRAR